MSSPFQLFFKLPGRHYSEDFVFWIGSEATAGKAAAFERLADILEPLYALLQLGVAFVDSFIAHPTLQDREVNFVTYWEAVLGGTHRTSIPQNWKIVRVCIESTAKSQSLIAPHPPSSFAKDLLWLEPKF